jgi:hypothetical protein
MLAIRRTTVTLVAQNLEKDGALIRGRGNMQIVNRDGVGTAQLRMLWTCEGLPRENFF